MSQVILKDNERHPSHPAYKAAHENERKRKESEDKQVEELKAKVSGSKEPEKEAKGSKEPEKK